MDLAHLSSKVVRKEKKINISIMPKNKLVKPFLKWVGGKTQLIEEIKGLLPIDWRKLQYFEPFIGGGACLFHLQPRNAVINDFNEELINTYLQVRDNPNTLIEHLKEHKNTEEYFYNIRSWDREFNYREKSNIERASRIIYLNKTCYNGLYRVNSAGEFNSPFGNYKMPNFVNEPVIRAVSQYLNSSKVLILNGDYAQALEQANENSFVYLDPPYHPVSESSNFTGYVQGGWSEEDQILLKATCDNLNSRGIKFLLSNSSVEFIRNLYKNDYEIIKVSATRMINSDADKRGSIDEVLIRNYE